MPISRKEFLRYSAMAVAGAALEAILPDRAKAQTPENPVTISSLETLFNLYQQPILEGINLYNETHAERCVFSKEFLQSLAFVLSGAKPTFVLPADNPDEELVGLMRIPSREAVLQNGKPVDLTDPVMATARAVEILTERLRLHTNKGANNILEALYDYIQGSSRKETTPKTVNLTAWSLLLFDATRNSRLLSFLFENLLSKDTAFPEISSIVKEGLRYQALQPISPVDQGKIEKLLTNFKLPTLSQPESHYGWDMAAVASSPVKVVANGEAVWTGNTGEGPTVIIKHQPDQNLPPIYTMYSGLTNSFGVQKGEKIPKGTFLGRIGNQAKPPHLHFAVYSGGEVKLNGDVAIMTGGNWIHPLSMLPEKANYPGSQRVALPSNPEIPPPSATPKPEASQLKPLEGFENQLSAFKRLEDLPGFEDRTYDVIALVGSPGERGKEKTVNSIIWHWTWTEPTGGNGVEIARLLGHHCYHFCILPQGDDYAKFQYLTKIDSLGNHATGVNATTIGISYIGKGPPTQSQERTRRLLTLWLMEKYNIFAENVKVHKEVSSTEDIAGAWGLNLGDPNWQKGANWERGKLASIQRALHPERWAKKDGGGKWTIPKLTDPALSIQEAAVVARMVAENWGIPSNVFLPLISSESNFRQWETDGRTVKDYTGGGGRGIGQIDLRYHPEVDQERAKTDAAYNLNESARILTEAPGSNGDEKILNYKGGKQGFLDFYRKVRDSTPPTDRETGLKEWTGSNREVRDSTPPTDREPDLGKRIKPEPRVLDRGPSDQKVIALTFDGGWADRQGKETLQALREFKVQSTLFLTGQYIEAGADLLKEMLGDGHEIGNHSFDHPDFSRLSESQIKSELERTAEAYRLLTGREMNNVWFRFPSGSSDQKAVQTVCNNGYQAVGWSVASRDWEEISPDMIFNDVVGKAHPGAIVVLHLGGKNTAKALEKIIPELRNRGYQLVALSEMFKLN